MRLDRTKHNKFVTGAVYGNTTSGGITPSSSTATAVGGGGSTVIIQGGGGSQEPVKLGLGDLTNVGTWANEAAAEDRFLVQVKDSNQWIAKPISDITGSGGSVSDEDLAEYAKINYVKQELAKKVDNDFFSRLFELIDENGNPIDVNDTTTAAESIKSKLGLWTEQYLSALGMNPANGEISLTLASLNDVQFANLIEGQSVVWDGSKWINRLIESGGIDESALKDYLEQNQYTTIEDVDDVATTLENSINEVDADLQEFKQTTVDNLALKLDTAFFKSVFGLMTDDGEIEPNSEIPTEATIKAKFGLWTEQFLSAKGMNPTDGSVSGIELKDLAGVKINSPQDGEGLVYQNGYWVNQVVQTGEEGNPFYVWQGESAAAPTLSNKPAVDWTTTALKNEHVDDYYVTTEGLVYQFTLDNSVYSWALVSDKYLVDCWNKLKQFDDDLTERVEALESGSATTIQSVGAGNVVTEVTKDGTVITVNKGIAVYSKAEVDDKVTELNTSLNSEISRAKDAESTLTTNLNNEVTRAKNAEATITTNLNNEIARAKEAEKEIDDKLDEHIDLFNNMFQLVTSDGVTSIQAKYGLWTDSFLSAKGANSSGGSSSGGGLIQSLFRYADLGKTFSDTSNDTFNAYTINKINTDLGSRISVLEGKATNVSFTQSLTSGTQIGSISIDGVTKNIYAPTIPTTDINKGVTAYGWGNHASVGYAMASALSGYQTKITSSNKLDYSLLSGVPTKLSQFTNDLGLGTFAYKSSLAFADLTNKPTTISGYGITDAYTKTQVDSALGGYLPLSGGTIDGSLIIGKTNNTAYKYIQIHRYNKVLEITNTGDYGVLNFSGAAFSFNSNGAYWNSNTIIHSGNIGSQSVASATKLQTARTIWGQSFDGTRNVDGVLQIGGSGDNYFKTQLSSNSLLVGLDASGNPTDFVIGWRNKTDRSVVITSSGNIGIGTNNPQYKLDVRGVIYSNTGIFSDGYVSAKGQNTSSDMRLKNVLNEVVLGVKDIANAPSVRFAWKNGGGVDVGSSAQYWQGLLPDAVKERDGMLEMQYANIALLSAIALAKNFETHEERIARLEKENIELRNEITSMQQKYIKLS